MAHNIANVVMVPLGILALFATGCPPAETVLTDGGRSGATDGGLLGVDAGTATGDDGGLPLQDAGGVSGDAGITLDAGGYDAASSAGADAGADGTDAGSVDAGAPLGEEDGGLADAGVGADAGPPQNPLADGTVAELVVEGFEFLEGPVWRPASSDLLFSDIPADTIYQLVPPATAATVFRQPSDNANGLILDTSGLLLAAEHGARRVSQTLENGSVVDFVSDFAGALFNSPNDIVVRTDGTVYFTDPPYGLGNRPREIAFNGVFRVPPGGVAVAEWEGPLASRPNGIVLSPSEATLYVADTAGDVVRRYTVAEDGALSDESVFATVNNPDGMAVDVDGNVYITTSAGVAVHAPDGESWGTITLTRVPANCTFGGVEQKTLYITAREGLYAIDLPIAGL